MSDQVIETTVFDGVVAAKLNGGHFCAQATSEAMRSLERMIARIAPTDIPILLVGESGTGKQVIAAEIHRLSGRDGDMFVHVSCAALTLSSLNDWLHTLNGASGFTGNGSTPRGTQVPAPVSLARCNQNAARTVARPCNAAPSAARMPRCVHSPAPQSAPAPYFVIGSALCAERGRR